MTATMWASVGVFGGTMISYVLTKKKDFRAGLSVGIGVAAVAITLLQYLF